MKKKKREDAIKISLQKSYGLQLSEKGKINYNFFPVPHLEIVNAISKFENEKIQLNSKRLRSIQSLKIFIIIKTLR